MVGRLIAGDVFSTVLGRFHYLAYGCGVLLLLTLVAMAVLGPRPAGFAIRAGVIVLMLGIAVYSGVVISGSIQRVQQAIGERVSPSTLPGTDERRIQFDRLHQLSTRLMMVNMAGALVLLYWQARE